MWHIPVHKLKNLRLPKPELPRFLQAKHVRKRLCVMFCCCAATGMLAVGGINTWVKHRAKERLLSPDQVTAEGDYDCIIVLGCLVKDDGTPSDMLRDRLERGIALYEDGAAPKILMSGDHGQDDYDEVNAMKQYAMDAGVPSEDIFMDHAGFSTYETMYRAKEIFGAERVLVVTQEYHLYRAVYIAQQLGMQADGVNADYHSYMGQGMRDLREVLARCKDFTMCIAKPKPTYLGETILLTGSGDVTNDKALPSSHHKSNIHHMPDLRYTVDVFSYAFADFLQQ